MRNALLMVFLAQGVPCLHAGDECGNSQQGNNNAYGLMTPLAWIQYDRSRAGDFLRRFTEKLIAFRKAHRVFHQAGELQGMDVSGCGCPDISFHGRHVWYPEFDGVSRQLGYSMREPVWETVIFTRHIICMGRGEILCAAPSAQRHVLGAGHRHVSPEAEMFPESPGAKGVGGAERNDCKRQDRGGTGEGRLPGGKDDTV